MRISRSTTSTARHPRHPAHGGPAAAYEEDAPRAASPYGFLARAARRIPWPPRGPLLLLVLFSALALLALSALSALSGHSPVLGPDQALALRDRLQELHALHPAAGVAAFVAGYVLVTGCSIPGAVFLTLAGGAVFGFWGALAAVSAASTAGACVAFLSARHVLRDAVRRLWPRHLARIDAVMAEHDTGGEHAVMAEHDAGEQGCARPAENAGHTRAGSAAGAAPTARATPAPASPVRTSPVRTSPDRTSPDRAPPDRTFPDQTSRDRTSPPPRPSAQLPSGLLPPGALYLLSLRCVAVMPYWLVNLLFGVTSMRLSTFALVSLVGMMPLNAIYVHAGAELGRIRHPGDILSLRTGLALCLLAVAPLVLRRALRQATHRTSPRTSARTSARTPHAPEDRPDADTPAAPARATTPHRSR